MPAGGFHKHLRVSFIIALPCACAAPPAAAPPPPPTPSPAMVAAIRDATPVAPQTVAPESTPVDRGELPWWHDLRPGIYRFEGRTVVLAVGRATHHHHIAEGFLKAKVTARLSVRKAAEPLTLGGPLPEPRMLDLFITREQYFLALYILEVPPDVPAPAEVLTVDVPLTIREGKRRRIGRHVFEGSEHLFLECEIEGPIANPDWGQSKASASLFNGR